MARPAAIVVQSATMHKRPRTQEVCYCLQSFPAFTDAHASPRGFLQGELAVAAALHIAAKAAAGGALRVQAFISATATPAAGAVLSQIPSNCLRKVDLSFPKHLGQQGSTNVACAWQKLHNLTSLTLQCTPVAPLLPALSSLQQLTQLELTVETTNIVQLAVLPAQLRSLTLNVLAPTGSSSGTNQHQRSQPLQLAHLTALEELHSYNSEGLQRLVLQQHDQLPAGLPRVKLGLCAVETLLQLCSLQELDLQDSMLTSWELFGISTTLTSLSTVATHYSAKGAAAAAAPRWDALPIECLKVLAPEAISPVVCMAQLGALGTSLKDLVLHAHTPNAEQQQDEQQQEEQGEQQEQDNWEPSLRQQQAAREQQVTAVQLADALRQLTVLEFLDLQGDLVDWNASSSSNAASKAPMFLHAAAAAEERTKAANLRAVVAAIARLPRLSCLALSDMPLGPAATGLGATEQQLACLTLAACELTDVEVNYILMCQTSLVALAVLDELKVTDSIMPVVGRGLQQLQILSLHGCIQISSDGLYCIQGMQQLTKLCVADTGVDAGDALWLQQQMNGRVEVVLY
jgi:hypothetical protein